MRRRRRAGSAQPRLSAPRNAARTLLKRRRRRTGGSARRFLGREDRQGVQPRRAVLRYATVRLAACHLALLVVVACGAQATGTGALTATDASGAAPTTVSVRTTAPVTFSPSPAPTPPPSPTAAPSPTTTATPTPLPPSPTATSARPKATSRPPTAPAQVSGVDAAAAARGRAIFLSDVGCKLCHTINGLSSGDQGPNLTHIASQPYDGLPNDPAFLHRWLTNPQAIKPGTLMPDLGLTPQQIDDLVAFLETLR